MYWVRIDNRLVHGQIIESWAPTMHTRLILVVNDELAEDPLRQEIMSLAAPDGLDIAFSRVAETSRGLEALLRKLTRGKVGASEVMVLFGNCPDARAAFEEGLAFAKLNVGNLHYGPGKRQLCDHVAVDDDDRSCLTFFHQRGVSLDFRCVPGDPVQVREW